MKILVLNCGSSSIKYQLIELSDIADLKAKGLLDRIGLPTSELVHQVTGKEKYKLEKHTKLERQTTTRMEWNGMEWNEMK